ncbi:hypothetical protein RAAC3_TM7C00001G0557 [Candidatus Saccharibacteria bacterium RAAC3_TM7_1]|nr:hypothetical protein RAAC3_TM7C00001G0557 [Candidatus Saccharibacteria bacterium RAAC3_TM7_1]HCZ28684.1 hypothetical protein [Candidatus Saccharibacteria bacterium]
MDSNPSVSASSSSNVTRSNKRKLTWGLVCLIGPTALLIAALLFYAIANFTFASMTPPPDPSGVACTNDPLAGVCAPVSDYEPPVLRTIMNVILFLIGAVATIAWLPGIILGIVLLATRRPNAKN